MKVATVFAALCLLPVPAANAEDPPFPAGQSEQTYEGMKYYVVMPRDYDPAKEYALLIGLHGGGADDDVTAQRRVSNKGMVIDFGSRAYERLLHFDEVTDLSAVANAGLRPDPRVRANDTILPDFRRLYD